MKSYRSLIALLALSAIPLTVFAQNAADLKPAAYAIRDAKVIVEPGTVLRSPVMLRAKFGRVVGSEYPAALMGALAHGRQTLLDAGWLKRQWAAYDARGKTGKRPPSDPCLEALWPALDGKIPVAFEAETADEIHRVLDFAEEFKLKPVIVGGKSVWKVVDRLKKENVAVILRLDFAAANEQETGWPVRVRDDRERLRQQEIACAAALNDSRDGGDFQPDLRASVGINPDSELIPVTRANGITTVVTRPAGSLMAGQGALINLAGWVPGEMVIVDPISLHIEYPSAPSPRGFNANDAFEGGENPAAKFRREEKLGKLKELFETARRYDASKKSGSSFIANPWLESLFPYVRGDKPVVFTADKKADIAASLKLADELKVKPIIAGGIEAWKLAAELKRRDVPVILGPIMSLPRETGERYDAAYCSAAKLFEAGVRFCIRSAGSNNARNLPYEAAMAVAYGLPAEEGLKAVTLYPAQILGVAKILSTVEAGKRANLILANGDILQASTQVLAVFIDGKPYEPTIKQTRLYDKYRKRLDEALPPRKEPVSPMGATAPEIAAVVESSLATSGARIRQFAFDADPTTYFASEKNPTQADHFTLTFDAPVEIRSFAVLGGRPNGDDAPTDAVVELSTDGKEFQSAAKFGAGKAEAKGTWKAVKALRIRSTKDSKHPLILREITLDSTPKVTTFRHPIEIALDVTDAPEMKEWGEKTIRICEREFPKICNLLASDGSKPPTQIKMTLKNDYKGVAAAGGGKITGSVQYFKDHPADIGAMVHETVHCVQNYRARNLPGWLVEGVADYIRFWHYEPGKAGKLAPEKARYDGSYRTTAAFLAYVTDKYEPTLVTKLNTLLREGKFDETVWKTLTGKPIDELNREWRESLAK